MNSLIIMLIISDPRTPDTKKHFQVTKSINKINALDATIGNANAIIENANATIKSLQLKLEATISEQHQDQLLLEERNKVISELQNAIMIKNSRKNKWFCWSGVPAPW